MGGAGFATHRKWAAGRARAVRRQVHRLQRQRRRARHVQGPLPARAHAAPGHRRRADRRGRHARQPCRPVRQSAPGARARRSSREAVQQWRGHALFAAMERLLGGAPLAHAVVAELGPVHRWRGNGGDREHRGPLSVPAPQAAVSCPAGRAWRTDHHQQHRDARACPGNTAPRRAVVSRSGHRGGQRHQALFALRRRVASGPVRAADGHAARGTRLRAWRRDAPGQGIQGGVHRWAFEHAAEQARPRRGARLRLGAPARARAWAPAR